MCEAINKQARVIQMIWASTSKGSITYAGPEWTVFTGQPTDAALGDGWLQMIHEDDRRRTSDFFKDACASVLPFTVEYRLHRVGNNYARVVAGAIPSLSPVDRTFIGFLGTINEIEDDCEATNILGRAILRPTSAATKPLTPIDIIADYLLLARVTAQQADEERLLASIDFAMSEVMRRLGFSLNSKSTH